MHYHTYYGYKGGHRIRIIDANVEIAEQEHPRREGARGACGQFRKPLSRIRGGYSNCPQRAWWSGSGNISCATNISEIDVSINNSDYVGPKPKGRVRDKKKYGRQLEWSVSVADTTRRCHQDECTRSRVWVTSTPAAGGCESRAARAAPYGIRRLN